MSPLISVEQLKSQLNNANVVVVDCRHDLAQPQAGAVAYAAGHIPGAIFAHLDTVLSGAKTGTNGRHPLPEATALVAWLGANGIGNDTHVVAYDASGGMFAARLWWLLRWLGHDAVQVLDGGLPAWVAAGQSLSETEASVPQQRFVPDTRPAMRVNSADVLANLDTAAFQVVDARSAERYAGIGETLDPVGGHIPGALNRFFQNNLDGAGRFKSPDVLRAEWQALLAGRPVEETVHQCGSGVTACHNLLALEVAGLPGARLYPGSWSEWCADPARPVAR
ncbi:sulfurtransferase [Chitiniphilus eburneus]|uniref:Sulfurtransferase n=1 Tax=Chitiniphilus eburneus TaxID=2571148 RepID=A0A4U0PYY5_9NEIS|nr:sulfurtransferase [Chitiniphilus eburneus]TJZ73866.1 sulfurtransferase [Chitiniphilus eburneus]